MNETYLNRLLNEGWHIFAFQHQRKLAFKEHSQYCLGSGTYGAVYKAFGIDEVKKKVDKSICQWVAKVTRQRNDFVNRVTSEFYETLQTQPLTYNGVESNYYVTFTTYLGESNLLHNLPKDPLKKLEIIRDIFSQLSNMHQHDVIHRDIKPNNVIWKDSTESVALTDFDLAIQLSSSDEHRLLYRPNSNSRKYPAIETRPDILGYSFCSKPGDVSAMYPTILQIFDVRRAKDIKLPSNWNETDFDLCEYIKKFLKSLLKVNPWKRPTADQCEHFFQWICDYAKFQRDTKTHVTTKSSRVAAYTPTGPNKHNLKARIIMAGLGVFSKQAIDDIVSQWGAQNIIANQAQLTGERLQAFSIFLELGYLHDVAESMILYQDQPSIVYSAIVDAYKLGLFKSDQIKQVLGDESTAQNLISKLFSGDYTDQQLGAIVGLGNSVQGLDYAKSILCKNSCYTQLQLQTVTSLGMRGYTFDQIIDCILPESQQATRAFNNHQLAIVNACAQYLKIYHAAEFFDDLYNQTTDLNKIKFFELLYADDELYNTFSKQQVHQLVTSKAEHVAQLRQLIVQLASDHRASASEHNDYQINQLSEADRATERQISRYTLIERLQMLNLLKGNYSASKYNCLYLAQIDNMIRQTLKDHYPQQTEMINLIERHGIRWGEQHIHYLTDEQFFPIYSDIIQTQAHQAEPKKQVYLWDMCLMRHLYNPNDAIQMSANTETQVNRLTRCLSIFQKDDHVNLLLPEACRQLRNNFLGELRKSLNEMLHNACLQKKTVMFWFFSAQDERGN